MSGLATMAITALAPWFGNNRTLAQNVGDELGPLAWCGVPFCGGCPELPYIQTRGGVANDLHRHIINLARVVRDDALIEELIRRLERVLFHPDDFIDAQQRCRDRGIEASGGLFTAGASYNDLAPDPAWAADYFVACWMGRGGHAGKRTEFSQGLALRWTSTGGDSARRFISAVESLRAWHSAVRPWSFTRENCFTFIDRVADLPGHGLYVDAPWPEAGDEYAYSFTDAQQRQLADRLSRFAHVRIVIRYGDHPMIRDLYSHGRWTWLEQVTRDQRNGEVKEVLIVNGPSRGDSAEAMA